MQLQAHVDDLGLKLRALQAEYAQAAAAAADQQALQDRCAGRGELNSLWGVGWPGAAGRQQMCTSFNPVAKAGTTF